jgi:DNA-binding response OmpR family regulator
MARVVALVPDLLFGSRVQGDLRAAGHEVTLAGSDDALRNALPGADALIVDLTLDAAQRIELVRAARPAALPVLAFYSRVEADVRDLGRAAGFELVVPRSRMAHEGPGLVARLLEAQPEAEIE